MQKLTQKILLVALAISILNPTLVMAQNTTGNVTTYQGVEGSLTEYLCTPDGANSRALEQCINKLYKFGIAFGAIALVFFVVFAGYMYMVGGETGKGKAKGILQNALVGMGILLFSYVLLRFINPNLVIYKSIQPPIFTSTEIPSCDKVGLGEECVVSPGVTGVGDGNGGGVAGADYDHAKSAELAKAIIATNKISYECVTRTGADGTKQNLIDATNQKASATTSRGTTFLHQAMLGGLQQILSQTTSVCLSVIAGGGHADNSRHYAGLAFDVARINGTSANKANAMSGKVMDICRQAGATEVLGPIKPDEGHTGHVHCAWPRAK